MNLQENIHRIKSVMGVINEDNRPDVIKNMIDELGVTSTIKMVGNYYMIKPYLKDSDKVNYLKEKVKELSRGGVALSEIGEKPIVYDHKDNYYKQIDFLGRERAYVDIYYDGLYASDTRIPYESLSIEVIERLIEILINH